jgi:hypothetical protein
MRCDRSDSVAGRFGDSGSGVWLAQDTAIHRQHARRGAPGKVLIARCKQDRVAVGSTGGDPALEVLHLIHRVAQVDEMSVTLVAGAAPQKIGARDMVNRSTARGRAVGRAEPTNLAAVGAKESGEAEQQRRLAGSGRAKQRDGFTDENREVDASQDCDGRHAAGRAGGESFREVTNIERDLHARWIADSRASAGIMPTRAPSITRYA